MAKHKNKVSSGQKVIEERENSHGNYTVQSGFSQDWKIFLRNHPGWEKLSPGQREALEMIAVKMSRIMAGNPNEPEHWLDISGYATLIFNTLTKGTHL